MKFLLGKKLGMTTLYDKEKGALNVTLIFCEPNSVSLMRNEERDGYSSVQLECKKTKRTSLKKEFRFEKNDERVEMYKEGSVFDINIFEVGDEVSISGISKAKGFQGVVKRHGFSGAPKTHGHKHDLRAPGSIGSAFPQHVFKGVRMAGRMGGVRSTMQGLSIVMVDKERSLLAVKGSVPGKTGDIVEIVSR
ncbi:MAG: 50S ribosomal protein L3 [Candidatus Moranbacteria bacterium]|nr:50S ribosomal protein L3 [Candidatus Moranbacteria bacterium]